LRLGTDERQSEGGGGSSHATRREECGTSANKEPAVSPVGASAGPYLGLSIRDLLIRRLVRKAKGLKRDGAMTTATYAPWIRQLIVIVRRLGPYAAIEIALPGGSLVVLLVWLFRQHRDVRSSAGWCGRGCSRLPGACGIGSGLSGLIVKGGEQRAQQYRAGGTDSPLLFENPPNSHRLPEESVQDIAPNCARYSPAI
jgi:hypothetical protein